MTEVSIRFDDGGWHVSWEDADAGEGEIKGCEHGQPFESFGAAMRTALEDVAGSRNGCAIKITRSAAKAARRQVSGVVA